jgi:hypothetical protein
MDFTDPNTKKATKGILALLAVFIAGSIGYANGCLDGTVNPEPSPSPSVSATSPFPSPSPSASPSPEPYSFG